MKPNKTKRAKVGKQMAIESGSGNVFENLGLPEPAERLAKAELVRVIRKLVNDWGWTQRRAAKTLQIAPPDMSDPMRPKLARVIQERLERALNALDMDSAASIRPT